MSPGTTLDLSDPALVFPDIPPFPIDVPTAPLVRFSLPSLSANAQDADVLAELFDVCKKIGFFYLDLRGSDDGERLLKVVDKMWEVGNMAFALEEDVKKQFDFREEGSNYGYKAAGAYTGAKSAMKDRTEFWNIAKDDILLTPGRAATPYPPAILDNRELISEHVRLCHSICLMLLEHINTFLQLPPNTLANLHRIHQVSSDQVRFVRAEPKKQDERELALAAHSDFGSVTVLFNRLSGLQVLLPEEDKFIYVRPLRYHAVINLGDSLVKFSNYLLRSNIHRVISPAGEQAHCTRMSLVYFSRPEDDVLLRRLESSVIPPLEEGVVEEEVTSKDWILRRALGKVNGKVVDRSGTERHQKLVNNQD
ncbi:Clavaminate synthase-like protein [Atractiella rhizophila]|nr:Clavaminate synthase-like protein [Atractiella rhizophila]